jgi:UMF1 family MFS transporter
MRKRIITILLKAALLNLAKFGQRLKLMPMLKGFLPAFFFYSMGVQTIMLVAAGFGAKD